MKDFNPRTPQGGATKELDGQGYLPDISIHAPRKGVRRSKRHANCRVPTISIHAPRKGVRRDVQRGAAAEGHFNPRTPQGGATW